MQTANGLKVGAVLLLSLVLGIGSALILINNPPARASIRNGAWSTHLDIGSTDANIYLRAVVARMGLFALNRAETIYFTADHDDSGERLRAACDYRIEGKPMQTRWWSITVYGQDHFLIPNRHEVYAYNMNGLTRDEHGAFAIHMSRLRKELNWLPSGREDQRLSLSLRCYNPDPVMYERPGEVELPKIIREGCR